MNIKFDELLSEIDNVWQKRRSYHNHVSLIGLKRVSYIPATLRKRNITTQHND